MLSLIIKIDRLTHRSAKKSSTTRATIYIVRLHPYTKGPSDGYTGETAPGYSHYLNYSVDQNFLGLLLAEQNFIYTFVENMGLRAISTCYLLEYKP